jgi:hypothetical protein
MLRSNVIDQSTELARNVPSDQKPYTYQTRWFPSTWASVLAAVLLTVGGVIDAANAASSSPGRSLQVLGAAASDPAAELLDWIAFFLNLTDAELEKASSSTTAALTTIQIHYLALGIPADLNQTDRASLMQSVGDLYFALSTNPPPDVSPLLVLSFRNTLKQMWKELGGNIDDLR